MSKIRCASQCGSFDGMYHVRNPVVRIIKFKGFSSKVTPLKSCFYASGINYAGCPENEITHSGDAL